MIKEYSEDRMLIVYVFSFFISYGISVSPVNMKLVDIANIDLVGHKNRMKVFTVFSVKVQNLSNQKSHYKHKPTLCLTQITYLDFLDFGIES